MAPREVLPGNVKPVHYKLTVTPDLVGFTFAGTVDVKLSVVAETTSISFNTHEITTHMAAVFTEHFGKDRVLAVEPQMGGEDFSEYYLADKTIQSLFFHVGGVPKAKWDAVQGDVAKLPSLHSPLWAPDAEAVISTAVEAMTTAALEVLKK